MVSDIPGESFCAKSTYKKMGFGPLAFFLEFVPLVLASRLSEALRFSVVFAPVEPDTLLCAIVSLVFGGGWGLWDCCGCCGRIQELEVGLEVDQGLGFH